MTWETTAADLGASLGGNGWVALALTAVLAHFLLLALLYMISKAFNLTDLYRWVKSELAQAVASAVLVGLIFGVVGGSSYGVTMIQNQAELLAGNILMPGAGGAQNIEVRANPFIASYAFLRNMADCAKTKYMDEYNGNRKTERLLSISFTLMIAGVPIPIDFNMILFTLYQKMVLAHYLANNYSWLAIAVYFQINFLQWIETSMFTVYLPIGIILRIFPWTRGAGGLLIAIAIGLYIVYPLMFVVLIANSGTAPQGCHPVPIEAQKNICVTDPASFVDLVEASRAESSIGSSSLGSGAASMIVFGYFYPMTVLVVVFVFIRTIASFLGADIADIGRGIFKMI